MQPIDYYKDTGMPYPSKKDYVRFQVTNMATGKITFQGLTKEQLEAENFKYVSEQKKIEVQIVEGVEYSVMYRLNEDEYKEHQRLYTQKSNALHQQFQDDLARSEGYEPGSDIANVVFSEAWDRGHSAGHSEVASYYSSVAEFAERVIEASKKDA